MIQLLAAMKRRHQGILLLFCCLFLFLNQAFADESVPDKWANFDITKALRKFQLVIICHFFLQRQN